MFFFSVAALYYFYRIAVLDFQFQSVHGLISDSESISKPGL